MRRLFAALCMTAFLAGPQPADARGDLRRLETSCIVKAGPDQMYFSAYLPNASHRKFCGDIPLTGPAIFVLDYAQPEMREMTAGFRIVRDTGEQDSDPESGATVAYLAPKRHPNGTLSLQHVFPEAGNFVAIVTLDGPNGEHWVSRFPFSVGGPWSARTPYYLLAAAAALALLLLLWGSDDASRK
jgi:hypothetical protein